MTAIAPGSFIFTASGRAGAISYREGARTLEIYWEMSGSPRYDILLAPLDLRYWLSPADEQIPLAKQKEILRDLRQWLASERKRADIDVPTPLTYSGESCVRSGCQHPALSGLAYCLEHFDESLLRS